MKKYYSGIGWRYNIDINCEHFHEIGYSLADKGWTLRTNGAKGVSMSLIAGVQRYCNNRKLNVENFLEVYLPGPKYNGYIADQPGFYNIFQHATINTATKLMNKFVAHNLDDTPSVEKSFMASPFVCFGHDLKTPSGFILMDVARYEVASSGNIINAQGFAGQSIRMLLDQSPESHVFNYSYKEHRQRINGLLNNAKK